MISQNTHDTHETNTMSTVFRPQHSPGFSGKVVDLPWSDHTTYFFFDSCWHKSRDAVTRAEEVWLDHLGRNPRRGEAVLHARCLDFIARAQAYCVQDCSTVWNREEAEFNSSLGKDGWRQMEYYKQEERLKWVKGQRWANSVLMTEHKYQLDQVNSATLQISYLNSDLCFSCSNLLKKGKTAKNVAIVANIQLLWKLFILQAMRNYQCTSTSIFISLCKWPLAKEGRRPDHPDDH